MLSVSQRIDAMSCRLRLSECQIKEMLDYSGLIICIICTKNNITLILYFV